MPSRRDGSPWAQYRRMRLAWWALTFATIGLVLIDSVALRLFMLMLWAVCSAGIAHWPCPACGKPVGTIGTGIFMMRIPFGGWCTHCATRLFLRDPAKAR